MPRQDGTPTTVEMWGENESFRRGDGLWPPESDCSGCGGHQNGIDGHPEGAYRFRCSVCGVQQLCTPVVDGSFKTDT